MNQNNTKPQLLVGDEITFFFGPNEEDKMDGVITHDNDREAYAFIGSNRFYQTVRAHHSFKLKNRPINPKAKIY